MKTTGVSDIPKLGLLDFWDTLMFIFLAFFIIGMFCFVVRPLPKGTCNLGASNTTEFENNKTTTPTTTTTSTTTTAMVTEIITGIVSSLPTTTNETVETPEKVLVTSCGDEEGDFVIETGIGVCYLHVMDTPTDKVFENPRAKKLNL